MHARLKQETNVNSFTLYLFNLCICWSSLVRKAKHPSIEYHSSKHDVEKNTKNLPLSKNNTHEWNRSKHITTCGSSLSMRINDVWGKQRTKNQDFGKQRISTYSQPYVFQSFVWWWFLRILFEWSDSKAKKKRKKSRMQSDQRIHWTNMSFENWIAPAFSNIVKGADCKLKR